jgi:hypothetical protein
MTLSDLGVNAQRNELVANEYVDGCMGDNRNQKGIFVMYLCFGLSSV